MKAVLRTRCGCTRTTEVPNPPPPDWNVPLALSPCYRVKKDLDTTAPTYHTRRFELGDVKVTGPYEFTAYYDERYPND